MSNLIQDLRWLVKDGHKVLQFRKTNSDWMTVPSVALMEKEFSSCKCCEKNEFENLMNLKPKNVSMGYSFTGTIDENGVTTWDEMTDMFQEGIEMEKKQKIKKYTKEILTIDHRSLENQERFEWLVDELTDLGAEVYMINGDIQVDY